CSTGSGATSSSCSTRRPRGRRPASRRWRRPARPTSARSPGCPTPNGSWGTSTGPTPSSTAPRPVPTSTCGRPSATWWPSAAARHFSVHGGDRVAEDAAWCYRDSPLETLRDRVRFDWGAMDAWFEEDEEVFVHPRSPYTRVDVLRASRPVRIEVDGVVVAETT